MNPRKAPRRRHYNEPGHAHELTFTCYRRYRFLASDRTCSWLADSIDSARNRLDFALWGFVFMPDHVHLLICPRQPTYDIATILSTIKAPVARQAIHHLEQHAPEWLPRITRHRGARLERLFWQSGGGFDRNVWEPKTLFNMIDYLHANPVRRGLVQRPSDWRWSSASWWYGDMTPCCPIPDHIPPDWCPQEA